MAIAKITLNGVTQMDVSGKTVTEESMLLGITALKNDGTDVTGLVPFAYQYTGDLTPSWTSGAINESTGGNVVSPYYIRTSYYGWDDQSLGGLEIIVPTGYQLRIAIYTTSGGVGGFIKFLDSALWNGTRFFLPQGYMFRAMLRYDTTPETEIATSAGSAVTFKKFAA